jgi:hypothetical protein
MIRGFIPFGIAFLAAVPVAAQPSASTTPWRTDVPCTTGLRPALAVADPPSEAQVAGCVRAQCIALPDGRRVCTCMGDTTVTVRVEADGRTLHEWPADHSLAGAPESLRALVGDLDGDGRAELAVAEWQTTGNGLGISYHRLSIFDGRDATRAPVRVQVQDFTPDGSFVRPADGGGCRLIATRWNQLRDARRGWGMYLIGQWMRYRDGRLEHDPTRPVIARRLLDRLADARGRTPGEPFAHLRHGDAEVRPNHDAGSLPPLAARRAGTILTSRGDTVQVALASGETVRFQQGTVFSDAHEQTTAWLVDGATVRPYPEGYAPADPRWLEGVPVTVATYRNEAGTVHLLIIHPPTQ